MLAKDRITLLQILDSINVIYAYIEGIDEFEWWTKDQKTIDACLMHILHIGEMVCKLSTDFSDNHDQIEWFKIRGLRNIIAHDYLGLDHREIWSVITAKLPVLKDFISSIL